MHETTITLPENAGISSASELRLQLLAVLGKTASGSAITIDASKTSIADSSFAQLLLSSKAEAAAKGVQLTITGLKEELSLKNLLCCDAMDEPLRTASMASDSKLGPSKEGSQ